MTYHALGATLSYEPSGYPKNPAWMKSEAMFDGAFGSRCPNGTHFCPCPDGYYMTGSILGRYQDGTVGGDGKVYCQPHKPGSQGPAGSCSGRAKAKATLAPFDIVVKAGKITEIKVGAPETTDFCFDKPPIAIAPILFVPTPMPATPGAPQMAPPPGGHNQVVLEDEAETEGKRSVVPYVIAGAAVVGIGVYLMRRRR